LISAAANPYIPRLSHNADLKSNNTALVLYALFTHPHLSRGEITRLTMLAPSTVSNITTDLIEQGIVRRAGNIGYSGAGRRSDILSRNPSARCVAAVHVTPERCHIGIVDLGYAVLKMQELIFDGGFNEKEMQAVLDALGGLIEETRVGAKLSAIALALPNHPRSIASIFEHFQRRFPATPVLRINNTEAMAVHEYYLHLGKKLHTVAYVYVGTGIGSGFIINGTLYRGVNGNACDLGHMYMTEKPLVCRCGREGCMETVSSERVISEALAEHYHLERQPLREELVNFLSARLNENDEFCAGLIREAAEYLGKGIFNLVSITDPQLVIVAGRLNALNPLFSSLVEEAYMRRARQISPAIVPLEFVPVRNNSGLIGAAMFAFISRFCGMAQETAVAVGYRYFR